MNEEELKWILHIYKQRDNWFDLNSKTNVSMVLKLMEQNLNIFSMYMI